MNPVPTANDSHRRPGFGEAGAGYYARTQPTEEPILRTHDHTDHCRTTQPRAGEWLKNGRGVPGIAIMAVGVLAVVSGDAGAAYRSPAWSLAMGVAALGALSVGAGWVFAEGRRVRRVEIRWLVAHPDGPTPGCLDEERCRYFAKLAHPEGHSSFCTQPS